MNLFELAHALPDDSEVYADLLPCSFRDSPRCQLYTIVKREILRIALGYDLKGRLRALLHGPHDGPRPARAECLERVNSLFFFSFSSLTIEI